jgi:hypothetical protein
MGDEWRERGKLVIKGIRLERGREGKRKKDTGIDSHGESTNIIHSRGNFEKAVEFFNIIQRKMLLKKERENEKGKH